MKSPITRCVWFVFILVRRIAGSKVPVSRQADSGVPYKSVTRNRIRPKAVPLSDRCQQAEALRFAIAELRLLSTRLSRWGHLREVERKC